MELFKSNDPTPWMNMSLRTVKMLRDIRAKRYKEERDREEKERKKIEKERKSQEFKHKVMKK